MKRSSVIALLVAVAVIGGAIGFFGGMSYGKNNPSPQAAMNTLADLSAEERSQLGGAGFPGGAPGEGAGAAAGARGGGFTSGSIVDNDGSTITIKLADGSTKYVLYSDSTTVSKTDTGSSADLVTGEEVTVVGTTNSDGSITAARIQLGTPAGGPPDMGRAAPGSATTASGGAGAATSSP